MDAEMAGTRSSKTTGDNMKNNDATTSKADDNDGNSKSTSGAGDATSADFVLFGARPPHLFDNISIAIDSLLTEEVATLPLLPRTLTESEQQQHQQPKAKDRAKGGQKKNVKPQTGEERLIGKLRKAYKRNLDLAEAYCSRNIFTVQYQTKTKRRKILENYLAQNKNDEDSGAAEKKFAKSNNNNEHAPLTLPASTIFAPPDGELPSPDQIVGMDKEILVSRQRLQRAKQRRIQLTRQLDRLAMASDTLTGVREALKNHLEGKGNGDGDGRSEVSMQKLQASVTIAMDGHKELKGWNSRAEEVLQILDNIKIEREEAEKPRGEHYDGKEKKVVGRELDERERKRMRADVGVGSSSHESGAQIASLLKKLRGN
mmetsp:Transcript_14115/g.30427  ORF Transcript_14115/g.30427 Transcript_14115/m.30427 type:complete len:372 (-) Transcript_14115:2601-3716(-)